MSAYNGKECAEDEKLLEAVYHLAAAFPQSATKEFCTEIVRQAKLMDLPFEQLDDSVNWLIRHHRYPTITIADVLDYDVKIKLYTVSEVTKMDGKFDEDTRSRYKHIYTTGRVRFFAKLEDILMLPDKFSKKFMDFARSNEKHNG